MYTIQAKSCASFVHNPKISTAMLIVQATTCPGCSNFKLIAFLHVHRPKISTAWGKISSSALFKLATFSISVPRCLCYYIQVVWAAYNQGIENRRGAGCSSVQVTIVKDNLRWRESESETGNRFLNQGHHLDSNPECPGQG